MKTTYDGGKMIWTDAYDKTHKPTILDLREYLSSLTMHHLECLNNELFHKYGVKATSPRHTQKRGWVFPYRLQGITLFSLTIRDETSFMIDHFVVKKDSDLKLVFAEIDRRCQSGFLKKVEEAVAARKQRARDRRVSDQGANSDNSEVPLPGSDPEKLNKFSWAPALSPIQLRKLYRSLADGMLDHDLLEEVGIQLYVRCKQGIEEYRLLRSGKMKCHHCGSILPQEEGLIICRCGYQYTFKGYNNSFNDHRMPGGSALHVFSEFVEKWPGAHTDSLKMNLIDWMIHQCHINMYSGLRLRSVLKNLIDAPQKTAEKLVLELAYGDLSTNN